jgi:hypothetical protein
MLWGCIALRQAAQAASNGRFDFDFDYILTFCSDSRAIEPQLELKASQSPPRGLEYIQAEP